MTKTVAKKVTKLTETTDKYISQVRTKENGAFAMSAAKYYPALKKLASK